MKLSRRIFLYAFLPVCLMLGGGFAVERFLMERVVKQTVRDSLRASQKQAQRLRAESEAQSTRLLATVAENPTLKASLKLLNTVGDHPEVRRTLEDQLRDLAAIIGCELMLLADGQGNLVAGVERNGNVFPGISGNRLPKQTSGLVSIDGRFFGLAGIPVNLGGENLGTMSVGRRFEPAYEEGAMVLQRGGSVVFSNFPGIDSSTLDNALAACDDADPCEVRIARTAYLSLPAEGLSSGPYRARTFQSIDAVWGPLERVIGLVFGVAGVAMLLAALLFSALAARSVTWPLIRLVTRLKDSRRTGQLPTDLDASSGILEVNQLAEAFQDAARTVAQSRTQLEEAYVDFAQSMIHALEARDAYTAGHSRRVSGYSYDIACEMKLDEELLETIRVGALLHDIGKIGVPDSILGKHDRLSEEEFEVIRQHPVIGQKILAGLGAFDRYIPIVELHHENHDGTGYPHGLAGFKIPLEARIVHVADAYDAMTSDRPYRKGMPDVLVLRILRDNAGTQFDPDVVNVFLGLVKSRRSGVLKGSEHAVQPVA